MSKFLKNISRYPLLLACLVIVAHLAIPHDHHLDISFSDEKCNNPTDKDDCPEKSGVPFHCHAFNDLISEKQTPLVGNILELPAQVHHSLGLSSIEIIDFSASLLAINNKRFIDLHTPLINFDLLRYSSLKAPPSLV